MVRIDIEESPAGVVDAICPEIFQSRERNCLVSRCLHDVWKKVFDFSSNFETLYLNMAPRLRKKEEQDLIVANLNVSLEIVEFLIYTRRFVPNDDNRKKRMDMF